MAFPPPPPSDEAIGQPAPLRHYVVLQHGLGGLSSDWVLVQRAIVCDLLRKACPDAAEQAGASHTSDMSVLAPLMAKHCPEVVLLAPDELESDSTRGPFMRFLLPGRDGLARTGAGVDSCAQILSEKLRGELEVPCSLSCCGHSMGGLILQGAFERLSSEHSDWWGNVTKKSFVTIATPHRGISTLHSALSLCWYRKNLLRRESPQAPWESRSLGFEKYTLYGCPDDPVVPFSSALCEAEVKAPSARSFCAEPQMRPGAERLSQRGAVTRWSVRKVNGAQGHTMGIIGNDQIDRGLAVHVARHLLPVTPLDEAGPEPYPVNFR